MIRALLTDLDGVIRIWDAENDARAEQAAHLPPGALRSAAFSTDLLSRAITGRIRDEEWRQQVASRLHEQFPGCDAQRAVSLWSAPSGRVDSTVLELMRTYRQRVNVILVTNATSRLPDDLARLGLLEEFDHIINSSAIGHAKPKAEIFRAALDAAGTSATETFFVDDSPANVAAAVQLGMIGHVYETVDSLRSELTKHGLF